MAAVNSAKAHTHLQQTTAPAVPKLRDSCDACAASKVKCTKEKPTCARCTKRGVQCEYFFTKRAGRKHNARPRDTTNVTLATRSSSNSSKAGSSTPPNLNQPSSRSLDSGFTDMSSLNITSPEDLASWWTWTSLNSDPDDFMVSPTTFPVPETIDTGNLGQFPFSCDSMNSFTPHDTGSFLVPEDPMSITNIAASDTPSLSTAPSLPPYPPSTIGDDQSSASQCSCLIRALGLLHPLFRSPSTTSICSREQGLENMLYQIPTIRSIIAVNEQTIEAIGKMLQCPCSQDGYLLAIISLVVFKVLDWYSVAARETAAMDDSHCPAKAARHGRRQSSYHSEVGLQLSAGMGSYCINGEDHGRMAAQLVVSELQRVQRLVNLLSERLKRADSPGTLDNREITSPFSSTVLNQLEKDLHKRLAAVCLEVVLKQ